MDQARPRTIKAGCPLPAFSPEFINRSEDPAALSMSCYIESEEKVMNSIFALYDDVAMATAVRRELTQYGIAKDRVRIIDASDSNALHVLTEAGLPAADADYYVEGIRQGGSLLSVQVDEADTDTVVDIMDRYEPVDVHERAETWQQSGWRSEGMVENSTLSTEVKREARSGQEDETTLPIIEEEIRVGKRQVAGGGVRVHTYIEERPVEEQVSLREESITVERRPVDRPIDAGELTAFKEEEFEVSAMKEEAVVEKQARIVEEVVVKKQGGERTETIRDTVRRTEVEVDQVTGQTTTNTLADSDFRTHYQTSYANSGYSYEQYEPAYRYGSTLASDQQYQGRDWNAIEANARKNWERQHKDSAWDNFKDAVRYSWEKTKNAVKP